MNWYLVHTKPKQEKYALFNLEQQGYECYLPTFSCEKLRQGALAIINEPLFPRYLFIRLGREASAKSWSPIRSTKGVNRLVSFGTEPAKIGDGLVQAIRTQEGIMKKQPLRVFKPGERVMLLDSPFQGIEAVYQMPDGDSRVMVLIELLSKPVRVNVPLSSLCKVG